MTSRTIKLTCSRNVEPSPTARRGRGAFTLIELLIVIAVIAILLSIMLPSLHLAKVRARTAICKSNLRQLHVANSNYVSESQGYYVAAAPDMFDGFGGRLRWHGVRESETVDPDPAKNMFDPELGPLASSLADGAVKECPEGTDFIREGALNAFEASCGGYGYNMVGVGSQVYKKGYCPEAIVAGMRACEIAQPAATVMFTDTAFIQGYNPQYLIEYSFCEPPSNVKPGLDGGVVESGRPSPSIHFRHGERANVMWCDGHASDERLSFSKLSDKTLAQFRIGWFGPERNELFDPN